MFSLTKIITNNNQIHSQLEKDIFSSVKHHSELIASLISGGLIIVAWLFASSLSDFMWIAIHLAAFAIGGFAKAKQGILDTFNNKTLNVELLMILAAIGSATIGYWSEGAILIFIFSLSGALETYTLQKSERDLSTLLKLQPDTALRINGGEEKVVLVEDLVIGDLLLIKPGERVAADGIVATGRSTVDESALTGESIPVTKSIGDHVYAGTINKNGRLTMEVTTEASQSFVQKIMALVQHAQNEKSPSQLFIERFESIYVKSVLTLVGMMIILPYFLWGWSFTDTIYRAMILLVVASPCALVASITPATLSAISNGARHGILFKSGVFIENLAHVKAIAFDKTGTLTIGAPEVTDFLVKPGEDNIEIIKRVTEIEKGSSHPLAEAIVQYAETYETHEQTTEINEMMEETGIGVRAVVNHEAWAIGNEKIVRSEQQHDWFERAAKQLTTEAKTLVYVTRQDEVIALLALKDQIRHDTLEAIQTFKDSGIHTVMLTGDHKKTAQAIAKEIKIDQYIANCMPDDKVHALKALKNRYATVMMIGDGINDAPALATADIGVAMGAGTDVALETADIILIKNRLEKMSHAYKLSNRMNRIIKQNVFFSISVILALIISNLFQVINLPLGVIGHEGSTILVILNGLRMLK
ncbi:heavy metal translocating P-type ATPase [Amphibacillus cookii]|uniref:heavy metal translocating P-type ATPase n=1 Tax=Amphibacillus cookii TaxID=767787 RepID=UPI001959BC13|nr:heavy metal translocating P-type ATPase [Amphibacillus cookii]MBM7542106.1 Cd2+/Zn2+-exporting ATPase [Amphibacillus cookii]